MSRVRAAVVVLVVLALGLPSAHAGEATATRPSATDPRIKGFDEPHLSWVPEGVARNQLFVWLPGTGGTPELGKSKGICETAAGVGYHVVSLMYPDKWASQVKVSQSDDPDAYMRFREGLIRGGPIFGKIRVAPWDSIESRLAKLLAYLAHAQAGEGWEQYLDSAGEVRWGSVAVAGSSQGGGHAYVIGKMHEVARVIMFNSPKDYSFHFDRPAKGFDGDTRTPMTRMFAFNHVRDDAHGCNHVQQEKILRQMGLMDLGVLDVTKQPRDYRHAHVLTTDMDVPSGAFHGANLTPACRCQATWRYLLTEP